MTEAVTRRRKRRRAPARVVGHAPGGKSIRISADDMMGRHIFVQGSTGSGKSYTTRKLTETWLAAGYPVLILDVEDEFHTLRSVYPEIVLIGGVGSDVPLAQPQAADLVEAVVRSGVSAILQLHEFVEGDRQQIAADGLKRLMELPREFWGPLLVVIDEVRLFAPQQTSPPSLERVNELLARGRKRQFTALIASQRAASVSKEALANVDTYIIGRTRAKRDHAAALHYLPFRPSDPEGRRIMNLGEGQFWVSGSIFAEDPVFLKIDEPRSKHPESHSVQPRQGASGPEFQRALETLAGLAAKAGSPHGDGSQQGQPGTAGRELEELKQALERERERRRAAEKEVKSLRTRLHEIEQSGVVGFSENSVIPAAPPLSDEAAQLLGVLAGSPRSEMTKPALAMMAGKTPRSQAFVRSLAELVSKDLARELSTGIRIAEAGGQMAEQPVMGSEFDACFDALHKGLDARERKALAALAVAHPRRIAREEVARFIGLTPGSRRLKPVLEKLAKRKLITVNASTARAAGAYVELLQAQQRVAA